MEEEQPDQSPEDVHQQIPAPQVNVPRPGSMQPAYGMSTEQLAYQQYIQQQQQMAGGQYAMPPQVHDVNPSTPCVDHALPNALVDELTVNLVCVDAAKSEFGDDSVFIAYETEPKLASSDMNA